MRARLVERGERRVDRLHRRLDQRRRLRGAALQPAHRGGERRHRRLRAGDGSRCVTRRSSADLFRLHHRRAPFGERGLLALPAARAGASSSTAWRSHSASRRARSTSARCAATAASRARRSCHRSPHLGGRSLRGRRRHRAARGASPPRRRRGRRAGRGFPPAPRRARAAPARSPADR